MHSLRVFLSILTFLGFLGTQQIHAISAQSFDMAALSFLESSKDSAIAAIEENNIYLNAKHIVIDREGIFLLTDENIWLQLSSVFSNERGVYTTISEPNTHISTVWPIIKCKKCGNHFAKTIFNKGECPVCGTIN